MNKPPYPPSNYPVTKEGGFGIAPKVNTEPTPEQFNSRGLFMRKYNVRIKLIWKLLILYAVILVAVKFNYHLTNMSIEQFKQVNFVEAEIGSSSLAYKKKVMQEMMLTQYDLGSYLLTQDSTLKTQRIERWASIQALVSELQNRATNGLNTEVTSEINQFKTQVERIRQSQQQLLDKAFASKTIQGNIAKLQQATSRLLAAEASVTPPTNLPLIQDVLDSSANLQTVVMNLWLDTNSFEAFSSQWERLTNLNNSVQQAYKDGKAPQRTVLAKEIDKFQRALQTDLSSWLAAPPKEGLRNITARIAEMDKIIQQQHYGDAEVMNGENNNMTESFANLKRYNNFRLMSIFIGLLVSLFAIWWLILRPIMKLYDFTLKVSEGRLDATLNVNQNDELGALAQSLSEMVTNLHMTYNTLQERTEMLQKDVETILTQMRQVEQNHFNFVFPKVTDEALQELANGLTGLVKHLHDEEMMQQKLNNQMAKINSMVENAPIMMMMADTSGNIQYINRKGKEILEKLSMSLSFPVSEAIGLPWERLYTDANTIIDLRQNEKRAAMVETQIGDETIQVATAPVFDSKGVYQGPMFSWDIVTPLRQNERKQKDLIRQQNQHAHELGQRVETLKKIVQSVELGNYNVQVPEFSDHTLDALSQGLKSMIQSLKKAREEEGRQIKRNQEIQEEIRTIAELVGQSLKDMAETVKHIAIFSETTSHQADGVLNSAKYVSANVGGIATAVEEMSVTSREIARNVASSAEISKKAVAESKKARDTITILGKNSEQVGNVSNVINRIAQQTNLLALNATIEAASAGEAGKGFAVVAGEVKLLAQQTSNATEGITVSIRDIQNDVTRAIQSIASVSEVITEMNEISESISAAIDEQSATNNEIAKSMSDTAMKVEEVVENIQGANKSIAAMRNSVHQGEEAASIMQNVVQQLDALVGSLQK